MQLEICARPFISDISGSERKKSNCDCVLFPDETNIETVSDDDYLLIIIMLST